MYEKNDERTTRILNYIDVRSVEAYFSKEQLGVKFQMAKMAVTSSRREEKPPCVVIKY